MPAMMQSGMLRMMAAMLPKAYTVTDHRIEPARATLSGTFEAEVK